MITSELTNDISVALSYAQSQIEPASKDAVNPHFRSKYATLAACKYAAQEALGKYGLAVIQSIETDIERQFVGVTTRIIHRSGQWMESQTWCKPKSLGPQDVGSCATYLRRYGYSAMVGLVSEDDDDGQSQHGSKPVKPEQSVRHETPDLTLATMVKSIAASLNEMTENDVAKIFGRTRDEVLAKCTSIENIKKAQIMIASGR